MAVGKWAIRLIAGLMAVGLAWLAVTETGAHLLATRAPEIALRLRPGLPEALNFRNSDFVSRGGKDQALLASSLAAAPLDSVVVRNLANAASNAGDAAKGDRLLNLAGRQTRRDTLVQQSLYYRGLIAQDYPAAFTALDPLLRRKAVSLKLLAPDLISALDRPAAVEALAASLATQPPWRTDLIAELGPRLNGPDQLSGLFDQMAAKGSPASRTEQQQLIAMWVKAGEYDRAARAAGATPGQITDGDFNGSDVTAPFNWTLQSTGQVTAELTIGSNGQKDLRAGWPAAQSAAVTRQMVILTPGAYRLSGTARVEALPGNGWAIWKVYCDRDQGAPLAQSRQTEEGSWVDFAALFVVPSGCPAVWVALTSLGGEGKSFATVWYDHLAITRMGD